MLFQRLWRTQDNGKWTKERSFTSKSYKRLKLRTKWKLSAFSCHPTFMNANQSIRSRQNTDLTSSINAFSSRVKELWKGYRRERNISVTPFSSQEWLTAWLEQAEQNGHLTSIANPKTFLLKIPVSFFQGRRNRSSRLKALKNTPKAHSSISKLTFTSNPEYTIWIASALKIQLSYYQSLLFWSV